MIEKKTISISSKWFDLISERLKNSKEFESVDEYVDYVLSELFVENPINNSEENPERYTEEEKAEIEKNLKDLGYI